MRILIAEDDLDISNLYKKALEKNRHQVVLTSNGSDCLTNYLTTLSSMASKSQFTRVRRMQIKEIFALSIILVQRLMI